VSITGPVKCGGCGKSRACVGLGRRWNAAKGRHEYVGCCTFCITRLDTETTRRLAPAELPPYTIPDQDSDLWERGVNLSISGEAEKLRRDAYKAQWQRENRAKCKANVVRCREKMRTDPERYDEHRRKHREWKRNNSELVREQSRRAYAKDPEKFIARAKEAGHKRRALERGAGSTGVTRAQWAEVLERHSNRCVYCQVEGRMTMDHVVPISRGGAHDPSNIVPACKSCNSKKYNRLPSEWRKPA
jgi:5-methylcytosine-specific restriction endonuclease McrA